MLKESIKRINTDPRLKEGGGVKRSPLWEKVRRKYLAKFPRCAVCNSLKRVEVHHIIPFYVAPSKELDKDNLISLCESKKTLNCHLIIGHGGNYRDFNPLVLRDAEHFYDLLHNWQLEKYGTQ